MSEEAFQFTIDRVRSQFSRAELLDSLRAYSRVNGEQSFGMREYDAWHARRATSDTIRRYFGTWGKALQAAGLRAARGNKLELRDMVAAFKDCWREVRSVPSQRQLEVFLEKGNFPFRYKSYLNCWGGLGQLAKLIVQVEKGQLAESRLHERRKSEAFIRRAIPLKLRTAILKGDGYRCVKCGANPKSDSRVTLEVDHIVAVARGGKSTPGNLQTLCLRCNQGKKDRDD
ncbi:MAG: HNH endonuclease [Rhodomicrobium sp.]